MSNETTRYLVLIETAGNQAYIFGTNKLRDVIGASELVHRAGMDWVTASLPASGSEVLLQASGKALVLFSCRDAARAFITTWSKRVIGEAPGLDAFGVIAPHPVDMAMRCSETGEKGGHVSLARAIGEAHREYERHRSRRPSPEARFARLPFAEACAQSRLPANAIASKTRNPESPEKEPASFMRTAKIAARDSSSLNARWRALYSVVWPDDTVEPAKWFRDPEKLAQEYDKRFEIDEQLQTLDWLAVVHADGNGLGQLLLNFGAIARDLDANATGDDYLKLYQGFSKQIDEAGEQAFQEAIRTCFLESKMKVPAVPVVVGGDDLTVIIDGAYAVPFAKTYAEQFCKSTRNAGGVMAQVLGTETAKKQLGAPQLGCCAGVSIAKPHFPFSVSYQLAEELTRSAKRVKTKVAPAAAAVDFHILYDSNASGLDPIRERYTAEATGARLTSKPYVISAREDLDKVVDEDWFARHHYRRIDAAIAMLRAQGASERLKLSSSQAHAVRERMFSEDLDTQRVFWNHTIAKAGLEDDWAETNPAGKDDEEKQALYTVRETNEGGKPVKRYTTIFLDAIEAREFVPAAVEANGEANHEPA